MPGILNDNAAAPDAEAPPAAPPDIDPPVEEFVVVNQEVTLEINFREQSVQGESRITIYLINPADPPDEVALDARQCEIDTSQIRVNGKPVRATYRDPYETLNLPPSWDLTPSNYPVLKNRMKQLLPRRRRDLPLEKREQVGCSPADGSLRVALRPSSLDAKPPAAPPGRLKVRVSNVGLQEGAGNGSSTSSVSAAQSSNSNDSGSRSDQPTNGLFEISIPFRTTHFRDGLHFVGVDDADTRFPHVYTRHSPEPGIAACIFPCIDDPGSRCFWKIHIKCPRTLGDALMQKLASHHSSDAAPSGGNGAGAGASASAGAGASDSLRELQLTEEDKLLDMTVVCSGNLVGEKVDEDDETKKIMTFEITDHGSAAHHIGFAVGPFEHVDLFSEFRSEEADEKLGASALKIHGYCLPGRQDEVRNSCAALAYAADEFAMAYGRYAYDSYKICFVDDMVSDTTPLLSFSLCSNRLLFPEDIEDRDVEVTRKLVHSLAYQYFGAYIVPNQRTEVWLTVGIAYYMTDLLLSKLCGNNDYRFRIKTLADRLADEDRGRPSLQDLGTYAYLGDFEMEFMALKAPLVLFILDKRLTKAAGSASASLARVISKIISKANTSGWGDNNNEIISSETFRRVCEKTSQYQLEAFWNQWVVGSGCPWLNIKQRFNRKRLCVEITVQQTQAAHATRPRTIRHADFWRELVERKHGTYARTVQRLFTGPMTIRIHEANGTPYEHIVEIREDAAFTGGAKFDIPYNTKYKRLKRNRRNRERAAVVAAAGGGGGGGGGGGAGGGGADGENGEEVIVFSLGDKLDGAEDMAKWALIDWTEQDEKNMDQESYEWIRIDSDFEWLVKMHTNMPSWMYLSQLQQDKDVAAQQDTLLYLSRIREHAMSATILTRTLVDERYFHGLRTMAAGILSRQSWKGPDGLQAADSSGGGGSENDSGGGRSVNGSSSDSVVYRGLLQLILTFREFYCYPDTTSRPNNFSDQRRYLVQCAIIEAIAKVQFEDKHPREAQQFLLDLLRFNDNSQNAYSDHIYVAKLLVALATSFCSGASASVASQKKGSNSAGGGGGGGGGSSSSKKREMDMVLTFDDALSDGGGDGDGGHGGHDGRGDRMDDDGFDLGADLERMEAETEDKRLLEAAVAEIERYRRMDEWTGSYQNKWTTAALEGKKLLMKAGVIPIDALEFVRYLQDGTIDLVQLKAFEALIELGLMLRPAILRLLLATMTTHSSPFVRDRLFKLFCQGLAAIAFGEHEGGGSSSGSSQDVRAGSTSTLTLANGQANGSPGEVKTAKEEEEEDEDDNGGVIIEQGDAIIKQHQLAHARRESIDTALRALKAAVCENRELASVMWEAMLSPVTGCVEKRNLMELLEVMFEGDLSLLLTIKHPTMWTAKRRSPVGCIIHFKKVQRPLKETPVVPEPEASISAVPLAIPASASAPAPATAPAPAPVVPVPATPAPAAPLLPPLFPTAASTPAAVPGGDHLPGHRTRLPDGPKKTGTPKIKLQTHRINIHSSSTTATPVKTAAASAGGSAAAGHTPILIRKPSISTPTPKSAAPTPASASAAARAGTPSRAGVGETISVHGAGRVSSAVAAVAAVAHAQRVSASPVPAGLIDGSGSGGVVARPTPPSTKRKRDEHHNDGDSGRRRKIIRIAVPPSYRRKLSPRASHWIETRRLPPTPPTATTPSTATGAARTSGATVTFSTQKPGRGSTPGKQQQQHHHHHHHKTAMGVPTPPDSTVPNADVAEGGPLRDGVSAAASAAAPKQRKPLPTRAPAAAPPPPPPASKPIFIKFKTKSSS